MLVGAMRQEIMAHQMRVSNSLGALPPPQLAGEKMPSDQGECHELLKNGLVCFVVKKKFQSVRTKNSEATVATA